MKHPTKLGSVDVRWMIRRDMQQVLAIESASFDFPWFEEQFIRQLRQRNCIGMVAEVGERIIGFMVYELEKRSLTIVDLAVAPDFRGKGIGWLLMAKLKSKLSRERRTKITAAISDRNVPGHLWFRRQGFRCVEILKEHFSCNREDAYLFERQVDEVEGRFFADMFFRQLAKKADCETPV